MSGGRLDGSGWGRTALVASLILALDQATKALVVASLARGESVTVVGFVELTYTRNSGIAFGAFAGAGTPVLVLTLIALAVLVGWFARQPGREGFWLPVGMLLGGALGNLVDRLREGSVVDFVDIGPWPAFNVADASIVLGVLSLALLTERRSRRAAAAEAAQRRTASAAGGEATQRRDASPGGGEEPARLRP